eukprot:scaffold4010_cov98-Phaeocystis_antarctica.AAC.8
MDSAKLRTPSSIPMPDLCHFSGVSSHKMYGKARRFNSVRAERNTRTSCPSVSILSITSRGPRPAPRAATRLSSE